MAPKSDKAKSEKAKKEKSEQAAKLAAMRRRMVVFPPRLGARELKDKFYLFWSRETKAHPRTRVLPAEACDMFPGGYPYTSRKQCIGPAH